MTTRLKQLDRYAFTLIELLVVISIIALLVGILLPALSSARHAAKVSKCLSNQKQIGIGIHTYATDFDGAIPRGPKNVDLSSVPGETTLANTGNNYVWFYGQYASHGVLIESYVSSREVMDCPDSPAPKQTPGTIAGIGDPTVDVVAIAYTYRNLQQTTGDTIENLGHNEAGIDATMLLWDVAMDVPATNVFGLPEQLSINHAGTVTNALYVDGHAESFSYEPEYVLFRQADYSSLSSMVQRQDNILTRFDYAPIGDLGDAPQVW